MNFFSGFFKGIGNCFKSYTLIFEKGLWPYLIYPLLIWIFIFTLAILGIATLADTLSAKLHYYFSFDKIPNEGHFLSFAKPFLTGYLSFIVVWVLKIFFWFVSGTLTKYVLLIVLSPLFAMLSEKTEEKLTGKIFAFSFTQLVKDIGRGIVISLRNLLLEYLFIILCFILALIFPLSAIVTTPLLFFVSCYFTGFTMLDYNSERHKFKLSDSFRFIRNNKGYACGIGFMYWFFMALPTFAGDIIGLIFGPTLAVIGAAISFLEIKNKTS